MAVIEAKVIQEILDEVKTYKNTIERAGEEGRSKLKGINTDEVCNNVPLTADKKVDTETWSKRTENEQNDLYQQLISVRDALHDVAGLDGPANLKSVMYDEYASNSLIIIWMMIGILLTVFLLFQINCRWDQATSVVTPVTEKPQKDVEKSKQETTSKPSEATAVKQKVEKEQKSESPKATEKEIATINEPGVGKKDQLAGKQDKDKDKDKDKKEVATEATVLTMVILLGALGGSLHLVSSLVMFIGNRKLKRSWLPYYLAMPFTGAGLAPIVYMLLRVGLLSPSGTTTSGSSLANLNLIGIYAFAVMSGLFSRVALDKLSEVFSTIFSKAQTPSSKDPLGSKKPPSDAAPSAGKATK
ncbi:MAG: hypothetical protein ABFD82_19770 [Syntrophaceae bacterium]